ncbi:MAG TPA: hypothetical protein VF254_09155 [Gammaproteobacteria bacterium]
MTAKENRRLYFRRMATVAVLYVAATFFAGYMTRQLPEGDFWRIPLALLPVLPAAGMLFAVARFVKGLDELEQRIHLLTAVIVLMGIVIGCITYGFLQAYAGFPGIDGFVIGMAGILGWALVHPLVRRSYA